MSSLLSMYRLAYIFIHLLKLTLFSSLKCWDRLLLISKRSEWILVKSLNHAAIVSRSFEVFQYAL